MSQGRHDHGVRELGGMRLQLRDDLRFTYQEIAGQECYIIEDPVTSRFHRVGVPEYAFLTALDGTRTIDEVLAELAGKLGRQALTENDAASICRWLIDAQLAATEESADADRLFEARRKETRRRLGALANPMFVKIPLVHPDRFLRWITPYLKWTISSAFFPVWLLMVAAGGYRILEEPERFSADSAGILAASNWLSLGIIWILLKLVHELYHGMTCKKYGGDVPESGLVLILFTPVAYVDVSSSWRLTSKWQRIAISTAGMYAELFIAGIAAIIWSQAEPGITRHLAYNVIALAGINTLLFNGNPLMRFDGYYVLADLLEIPNLYTHGRQYLMYLGRRYLAGVKCKPPHWPPGKGGWVRVYGVLSGAWRVLVLAGLLIAAHALFLGAGLLLALFSAVLWFLVPLWKLARYLSGANASEQPNLVRFVTVTGVLGTLAAAFFLYVPWPGVVKAPGVADFVELTWVRAESPGFALRVHVGGDETVAEGQLLLDIENRELQQEVADLELAIEESLLRDYRYRQSDQLAAAQVEQRYRSVLEERLAERRSQLAALQVRAPHDGRVLQRSLDTLPGSYLQAGDTLVGLAGSEAKEVTISVRQEDVDLFQSRIGRALRVRPWGSGRSFRGQLIHLSPEASRRLPHPALGTSAKGPLAVQPASAAGQPRDGEPASGEDEAPVELVTPRVTGTVRLPAEAARALRAGQRTTIQFRTAHETVGQHLYLAVADWVRRKVETSRQPRGPSP